MSVMRAVLGLFVVAAVLSACGDGSSPSTGSSGGAPSSGASSGGASSGAAALKVDDLIKQAAPAVGNKATTCPVSYDVSAAASAAGLSGSAALADTDPVKADTSESATAGPVVKQLAPAVTVECDYQVGGKAVKTYLVATGKANGGVSGALPMIGAWSGTTDLADYVKKAIAAKPGTAVAVPNGKAAVVRLNVSGGDGALAVGVDGVTPDQLKKLTETLAAQVH
jgi:hypothetical protein